MIKKIPDAESEEARWVTIKECEAFDDSKPGLRGGELIDWASYLEKGGQIWPLDIFGSEGFITKP